MSAPVSNALASEGVNQKDITMNSGWTPGQWEAVEYPSGWTVRTVYQNSEGLRTTAWPAVVNCGSQPNEANARLIAAAPDLYEAGAALVGGHPLGETDTVLVSRAAFEQMRSALLKANPNREEG